jgi:hypothetical protein
LFLIVTKPEKEIPARSTDEPPFRRASSGKIDGFKGNPLPNPSERRDRRGVCKNGLQNLEAQGFRGQNLDNTGVSIFPANSVCTASALAMICSLNFRVKVTYHIGLWRNEIKSHAAATFELAKDLYARSMSLTAILQQLSIKSPAF